MRIANGNNKDDPIICCSNTILTKSIGVSNSSPLAATQTSEGRVTRSISPICIVSTAGFFFASGNEKIMDTGTVTIAAIAQNEKFISDTVVRNNVSGKSENALQESASTSLEIARPTKGKTINAKRNIPNAERASHSIKCSSKR